MSRNLDQAKAVYEAFAAGDIPTVLEIFDAEILWKEAAGGPYGGDFIGPNAVLENVFMKLATEWQGFAAKPAQFVEDGDHVVVLGEYTAIHNGTGKPLNAPFAHAWTFAEGKAKMFHQYTDTALHWQAMKD